MKKLLFITLLILLGYNSVQAQSFSPDRPGIGNGSFITPENVIGVEAGIQFSHTPFIDQIDIGQILLRYGILPRLEIRTALNSYSIQKRVLIGGTDSRSGNQDIGVGLKYSVIQKGAGSANVSVLGSVSIPTGQEGFTNDEFVPFLSVLGDVVLSDELVLSSNIGYSFGVGSLDDHWLFTFTPGFTIPQNEILAFFIGYAGSYYGNSVNENWLEGGITFSLLNGAQLDINLGYELEGESAFIGAGLAKGF